MTQPGEGRDNWLDNAVDRAVPGSSLIRGGIGWLTGKDAQNASLGDAVKSKTGVQIPRWSSSTELSDQVMGAPTEGALEAERMMKNKLAPVATAGNALSMAPNPILSTVGTAVGAGANELSDKATPWLSRGADLADKTGITVHGVKPSEGIALYNWQKDNKAGRLYNASHKYLGPLHGVTKYFMPETAARAKTDGSVGLAPLPASLQSRFQSPTPAAPAAPQPAKPPPAPQPVKPPVAPKPAVGSTPPTPVTNMTNPLSGVESDWQKRLNGLQQSGGANFFIKRY